MMSFLEFALYSCLTSFYELTSSYGFSLILLSFAVSVCLAPFYYLTGILEKKERIIKRRLEPFIQKINSIKNSKIKHFQLKELYNSFSYYPFYTLRSLASLFIQIPMLFAAYNVLTKNPLNGEQFLFLSDLGKPDFLLFEINLLPMIMTFINIASVFLSSEAKSKERRQGIFIAMAFFVLLYNQNSALLIYWTFNQFFSFVRYALVYKASNLVVPKITLADIRGLILPKPLPLNFVLCSAAMAFPATLIYKQNAVYFVGWDLQVYIAVLFLVSLALALLFKFWIAVSLILSLMFLPMLREVAQAIDGSLWLSRFLCFFVILYFIHFLAGKKTVLTVFLVCATVYCAFFMKTGDKRSDSFPQIEIPKELAELELKDSSSIYLFMHDAFPHKDYADYLNLPNYGELMDVFEKNGFNVYDVYSLADVTLLTMYSVFQMSMDSIPKSENGINTTVSLMGTKGQSGDYFRYFLNGNNIANLLLKDKDYKTGISNISNRWLFSKNNVCYDFWVNDKVNSNNVLKEIFFRGRLNSIFAGGDIDLNLDFTKFVTENNNKNKIFAWTTAGPGHSSRKLNSGAAEVKRWLLPYNGALDEMQMEIDAVIKSNPDAIIIFMSDHGPYLIDIKRIPKNYDFNRVDHIKFRDIFGAFMAIRWPNREKAAKYDNDFNVIQNLFPVVFAYLFDSEIPLKYKIQNTELQLGPHKFDKGVFYPYFYKEVWNMEQEIGREDEFR